MTHSEMLDIDMAVCKGLGKKPGETILTAASRALRASANPSTKRAASILLSKSGPPDVWERMRRAAELLQPHAVP